MENIKNPKKEKKLIGVALNDCSNQTVVVLVERIKNDHIYQIRYRKQKKYIVHCKNEIKKGQKVIIKECRPISKRKRWQTVEFI